MVLSRRKPTFITKEAKERKEREIKLRERVQEGGKKAEHARGLLEKEYGLKVYTEAEIEKYNLEIPKGH